jgi:diacylglycerol kinase
MDDDPKPLRKFLRSFVTGFFGFTHVIQSEMNMRIHCAVAVAVVFAGFAFGEEKGVRNLIF